MFAEKLYNVEAEYITVDFAAKEHIYDIIRKSIEGKEIGILGLYPLFFLSTKLSVLY